MPSTCGQRANYLHLPLYFRHPIGERFSNRLSKTHSSPASAANASGFLQIALSQMLRRDTLVTYPASTRRRTCDRALRFFANVSLGTLKQLEWVPRNTQSVLVEGVG